MAGTGAVGMLRCHNSIQFHTIPRICDETWTLFYFILLYPVYISFIPADVTVGPVTQQRRHIVPSCGKFSGGPAAICVEPDDPRLCQWLGIAIGCTCHCFNTAEDDKGDEIVMKNHDNVPPLIALRMIYC